MRPPCKQVRGLYKQLLLGTADIVPVNSTAAEQFAEIITNLLRKGKPIPVNDTWIAAIALADNFILVICDEHFQYVDGLTIEDWNQHGDNKNP